MLKVGDRVRESGGETGTIVRACGHVQFDWMVELDAKPEKNIPTTELPFNEEDLQLEI